MESPKKAVKRAADLSGTPISPKKQMGPQIPLTILSVAERKEVQDFKTKEEVDTYTYFVQYYNDFGLLILPGKEMTFTLECDKKYLFTGLVKKDPKNCVPCFVHDGKRGSISCSLTERTSTEVLKIPADLQSYHTFLTANLGDLPILIGKIGPTIEKSKNGPFRFRLMTGVGETIQCSTWATTISYKAGQPVILVNGVKKIFNNKPILELNWKSGVGTPSSSNLTDQAIHFLNETSFAELVQIPHLKALHELRNDQDNNVSSVTYFLLITI
jgi:hypothetical protein